MIYCMFKKLVDGSLKFEGVASSTEVAQEAIKDGVYVVCPIELDRRYDENIASEGFSGAITVKATVTDQTDQIIATLTALDNLVRNTMIPQLQDIPSTVADLVARVDALEGN